MRPAFLIVLSALSACAFSNVPIHLSTSGTATGISGGEEREVVVATLFSDDRQIRERCGMQKNGYGMDTASAVCSEEPAAWFANVLSVELRAAGFSVVRESAKPSALRVQGSLLKIFVEPVMGFTTISLETDLHIKLVATSETGLVAERSFFVKSVQSGLAATPSNFQKSVDEGTRRIVKDMVAAIVTLMNRYPQLGSGADYGPIVVAVYAG